MSKKKKCDVTSTPLTIQADTQSAIQIHLIFRAVDRTQNSEMMTLRDHRCYASL